MESQPLRELDLGTTCVSPGPLDASVPSSQTAAVWSFLGMNAGFPLLLSVLPILGPISAS